MPVPVKQGYAVNFCISHEAHRALMEMLHGGKRYGALLSSLILAEKARREERQRIARELLGPQQTGEGSLRAS